MNTLALMSTTRESMKITETYRPADITPVSRDSLVYWLSEIDWYTHYADPASRAFESNWHGGIYDVTGFHPERICTIADGDSVSVQFDLRGQ